MRQNSPPSALRSAILVLALVLLQVGAAFAQSGAKSLSLQPFHDSHPAMGTVFTIDVYAPDQQTADEWMQMSFDEIDRIEALLSNYRSSSELSRINREAADHAVTTDPETFSFLRSSVGWSRRTGGAFDMTVGPLMRAWGFFFDRGRVPSQTQLQSLRKQVGWEKVILDPANRTVRFAGNTHIELDPGGIGKGYAVDHIAALLRQQHVRSALISAGTSTIYAIGSPPDKSGWLVHVPDPAHNGKILSTIVLKNTSLSTSGCTEKFFIKNGRRYCHILDPRTMSPVQNMLQTTVISPSATDSDALSTATFVMGPQASARVLRSTPHSAAIIVSGTIQKPRYTAIGWPGPLNMNPYQQQKREA
ncbi:MAG TPA: FAD:protein FMN transferase [Edaphobacter sp.]|nr:FAD:protein FMN transferase [Edaphobacter sp.]